MNYNDALEYIQNIGKYGIVPGLDSIKELCRRLGNPQDSLKFVHIAGTNGKGSTLAYISTILRCAGYKVGRYISPVIFEYRERIQVGKRFITKAALCEGMELIRNICDGMVQDGFHHPTPFEVETALAFWYFQKENCDIVVMETGMGGLMDATNLITTTQVAVLASISMDHMQYLGDTLAKIAEQKAGIIKNGCRVVSMWQKPEAMQVVEKVCREKSCVLTVAETGSANLGSAGSDNRKRCKIKNVRYGIEKQSFDYGDLKKLEITMAGKFQIDNAALAMEAISALGELAFPVSEKKLRQGLKETQWLGRFSLLAKKPFFVVDGAHNEDAAQKLAESIEFYFTNKRIIYIMGILKDKEYNKVIALTEKYANHIITVTSPDNPRALHAYELAREIAKVHPNVTAVDSLEEAVEMSYLLAGKDDVIIAFGSLSYLGKLINIVENRKK